AKCRFIIVLSVFVPTFKTAVEGRWSEWSDWSVCGAECRKYRQRYCDNPAPENGGPECVGEDLISVNCTGGMCNTVERVLRQDITLIAILAVLVPLILLLLLFAFRKYNNKNRQNGVLYETTDFEFPVPLCKSSIKKSKSEISKDMDSPHVPLCFDHPCSIPPSMGSFQKSLVGVGNVDDKPNEEDEHYSTPSIGTTGGLKDIYSRGSHCKTPSEHHYDVPLLKTPTKESPKETPVTSPLPPSENVRLISPPPHPPLRHPSHSTPTFEGASGVKDWRVESLATSLEKKAKKSASHSSLSDNCEIYDKNSNTAPSELKELEFNAAAWGVIGSSGGRLVVPECNISLTIPEGAISSHNSSHNFYIAVTLLSPVICCGPSDIQLKKASIISFEHSGSFQHATWKLHLLGGSSRSPDEEFTWEKLITLGEERVDTPVYLQLDGSQVHLVTDHLRHFVLVGESMGPNPAVKQLRVVVTAPPPTTNGDLMIRIHIIQDTAASLACVSQLERQRGASLLDKPRTFLLHDCDSNLSEISFSTIWNCVENSVFCTFTLEREDLLSLTPLSCRVLIQQKGSSTHRQIIRVNTDFPYAPVTASTSHHKDSTVSWKRGSWSLVNVSPEIGAFRISPRAKKELCRCLDPPNAKGNDWRMLAARLNVDRYVNFFASKGSPTEQILDLWEARHRESTALIDLLNVLRVMGRPDAAHVLDNHSGSWI
ncbi:Netrin receptor UNC5B, partial [Armadillidium nasatum]